MNQEDFQLSEPVRAQHKSGMGQHERVQDGKDEWFTPPEIIQSLGEFDLDPCSPINRPWPTAKQHFTVLDNGLAQQWHGRVWMNPPYGSETERWMARMVTHGNGIALIFARTETQCWHSHVWPHAHSILFLEGRLFFYHVNGICSKTNAGAPSCLVAYGPNNTVALEQSGLRGKLVRL